MPLDLSRYAPILLRKLQNGMIVYLDMYQKGLFRSAPKRIVGPFEVTNARKRELTLLNPPPGTQVIFVQHAENILVRQP